jgi:hypothetical protein
MHLASKMSRHRLPRGAVPCRTPPKSALAPTAGKCLQSCTGLVSVNDYLIQDIAHAGIPLPSKLEWGIWTQFYFATERGRAGLTANRNDIADAVMEVTKPV